ncbi:MAG: cytochrome c-type biogenesis protein CcmH [Dehalococcoidia bacterium]|nr:cytochrome c-type biogenesis protein CcmH [Dehalococcoidia bacterium]
MSQVINKLALKLRYRMMLPFLVLVILTGCNNHQPEENVGDLNILAQDIDRKLMCPVCPSETIDQSQTLIAKQMRGIIREKLNQGENTEDILNYFVDRYGVQILAEPPKSGSYLLIWIIPPIGLVLGSVVLVVKIVSMRKKSFEDFNDPASDNMDKYLLKVDGFIDKSINKSQITDQKADERATK